MSTENRQSTISSMYSIINSIDNDRHVYRWFLLLINVPRIKQKLSLKETIKKEYLNLNKIEFTQILSFIALILVAAIACVTKHPLILSLGIFPLAVLIHLFQENRRCVAAISNEFLLENIRQDELNQQTLFQICERLSKQYDIPSLVDIIAFGDLTGRKILLGSILFLPFVYAFNSLQILIAALIVLGASLAIANTSFVLHKIK